jgi:hypothetical protein
MNIQRGIGRSAASILSGVWEFIEKVPVDLKGGHCK